MRAKSVGLKKKVNKVSGCITWRMSNATLPLSFFRPFVSVDPVCVLKTQQMQAKQVPGYVASV